MSRKIKGLESAKFNRKCIDRVEIISHNYTFGLVLENDTLPYDEVIAYLLVMPSILFFCIAEMIPVLKRSADRGG